MLDAGDPAVFGFLRRNDEQTTLVLANFSDRLRTAAIPSLRGRVAVDSGTGEPLRDVDPDGLSTALGPYEFRWLRLE
jgi:hypothetical protein